MLNSLKYLYLLTDCVKSVLECVVLQGYRVAVRLLQLERFWDYVSIRGGRTGQPEYRFPKPRISDRPPYFEVLGGNENSIGVGDVLEFSDPFITIIVNTDQSVALEGFELEIAPFGKILFAIMSVD